MDFGSILDFFNNLTPNQWSLLQELAVAAVALPIVTQLVKGIMSLNKHLKLETDNGKFFLSLILAMLSGGIAYIHGTPEFGAWFALAQGAINFTTSQPAYRFGLKQLFRAVGNKLAEVWQRELAKAYENNARKAAEVTDSQPSEFL